MFINLAKDNSGAVVSMATPLSSLTSQQSSQPSKKHVLPIQASLTSPMRMQPLAFDNKYVNSRLYKLHSSDHSPHSERQAEGLALLCYLHPLQLTAETRNLTPEDTLTKVHLLFIQ